MRDRWPGRRPPHQACGSHSTEMCPRGDSVAAQWKPSHLRSRRCSGSSRSWLHLQSRTVPVPSDIPVIAGAAEQFRLRWAGPAHVAARARAEAFIGKRPARSAGLRTRRRPPRWPASLGGSRTRPRRRTPARSGPGVEAGMEGGCSRHDGRARPCFRCCTRRGPTPATPHDAARVRAAAPASGRRGACPSRRAPGGPGAAPAPARSDRDRAGRAHGHAHGSGPCRVCPQPSTSDRPRQKAAAT